MQDSKRGASVIWSNADNTQLIANAELCFIAKYPPGQLGESSNFDGNLFDIPGNWSKIAEKVNHNGKHSQFTCTQSVLMEKKSNIEMFILKF